MSMKIFKVCTLIIILFSNTEVMAQENEKCFMCHTHFLKKPLSGDTLFVDKNLYTKSVHGKLSCTKCHKDIELKPVMHEPSKYKPGNACVSCHKPDESKHSRVGISCNQCHFDEVKSHLFFKGKTISKSNKLCLSCHANRVGKLGVHENLLCLNCHQDVHKSLKAQNCTNCHTNIKTYQHKQVECLACHNYHNVLSKVDCAKCHFKNQSKKYKESIHGVALQKGNNDVPDCKYCHGKIHEPSKARDTLTLCIECHADKEKMAKHNLTTYPVISYQESFHGIAHKYGQKGVPVCIDCHNTHDIRTKDDPKSSINKTNIPEVCARCHKNPHPDFATNPVHLKPKPKGEIDAMIVFWINALYMWFLIPGVIGGMLIHVSLDLFRKIQKRKKK